MSQVEIYTDGACSGNPGPGGYGVVLKYGDKIKELSAAYRKTTNNRMEILAAIIGLEALRRPCTVTLYSDSQYLVNAMTKGWVKRWKANNWMRNKQEAAKNIDLWERMLPLLEQHQVDWVWVKGHADNYYNNRCDFLAVRAIKEQALLEDEGFKK
ncbi:Ribonuclease H [Desulfofarcimen acetoxidans DSM 771]|uniref:Ribonuclease H n=1 Tax=Desulfofarcimen acetoxidans (strain ATCC 49208 / DSM 771 / KCTC 5769 / VKM B-1644 / 5575) TaxID=485916 RepID=C8W6G0_DESAS|nr:ribonuclease HI [Desulfofarcimen acetoxidans]ACV62249.1 Ribonuclease H [Desulfofarcimen acetoxidans DSM 771]